SSVPTRSPRNRISRSWTPSRRSSISSTRTSAKGKHSHAENVHPDRLLERAARPSAISEPSSRPKDRRARQRSERAGGGDQRGRRGRRGRGRDRHSQDREAPVRKSEGRPG